MQTWNKKSFLLILCALLYLYDCLLVLAYRNWMNSLGVKPYVNYLYLDLRDGLIVLQLYDIIEPGVVNWDRVQKEAGKLIPSEKLKNCKYAVKLGKRHRFLHKGAEGDDLLHGNQPLAFLSPIMRAYTLGRLSKSLREHIFDEKLNKECEQYIINWVNNQVFAPKPCSLPFLWLE